MVLNFTAWRSFVKKMKKNFKKNQFQLLSLDWFFFGQFMHLSLLKCKTKNIPKCTSTIFKTHTIKLLNSCLFLILYRSINVGNNFLLLTLWADWCESLIPWAFSRLELNLFIFMMYLKMLRLEGTYIFLIIKIGASKCTPYWFRITGLQFSTEFMW